MVESKLNLLRKARELLEVEVNVFTVQASGMKITVIGAGANKKNEICK